MFLVDFRKRDGLPGLCLRALEAKKTGIYDFKHMHLSCRRAGCERNVIQPGYALESMLCAHHWGLGNPLGAAYLEWEVRPARERAAAMRRVLRFISRLLEEPFF